MKNIKRAFMYIKKEIAIALIGVVLFSTQVHAQSKSPIIVSAGKPIAEVQPTMWGIFLKILTSAPMAAFMRS